MLETKDERGKYVMKAEAKSLKFLGENPHDQKLVVPFFQRRYIWDESNWKELYETLDNSEVKPYLGSIILKESNIVNGISESIIIDGQQRLTTLTILSKAIYDSLPEESKAGSGIRRDIEALLFYRRNTSDDFTDSYIKIEHSRVDAEWYTRIILAGLLNEDDIIPFDETIVEPNKIFRCYQYFRKMLADKDEKDLRKLHNIIYHNKQSILVIITLDRDDINEQTIFDTINRAGTKLTIADIIKNNIFKRCLERGGNDPETKAVVGKLYEDCWEKLFCGTQEILDIWDEKRLFGNTPRTNLEFLLYCFACIKWGRKEDSFSKLEKTFNDETEGYGYQELKELVKEICEYGKIFKQFILDFSKDFEQELPIKYNDHVQRLLVILEIFGVQMFYPYVIKRLKETDGNVNDEKLIDDFRILESFIIRRRISPKGVTDYSDKCSVALKEGIDSLIKSDLAQREAKLTNLDVMDYLSNIKDDSAKVILFLIELNRRSDDLRDVQALEYRYTLEHIMPKKWLAFWNDLPIKSGGIILDPDSDEGRRYRDTKIQAIGNKTLLTSKLNSTIKNSSYNKKIKGDGIKRPGYESHASLMITKELVDNYNAGDKVWDECHIDKRTEELYEEFIKLWPTFEERIGCEVIEEDDNVENEIEDPELEGLTEEELADPIKLLDVL